MSKVAKVSKVAKMSGGVVEGYADRPGDFPSGMGADLGRAGVPILRADGEERDGRGGHATGRVGEGGKDVEDAGVVVRRVTDAGSVRNERWGFPPYFQPRLTPMSRSPCSHDYPMDGGHRAY